MEALKLDQGSLSLETEAPPHIALQRVAVRLLFDPAFVEEVYADPAAALSGLGIPERYQAQLVSNDRRLWGADRLRRRRALKVLMEEFKTATAMALLETGRLAFLDDFFSSTEFHRSVQGRGYMALAFSDYLNRALADGTLTDPRTRALLALEGAMALMRRELKEARRRPESRELIGLAPGRYWRCAPGRGIVRIPAATFIAARLIEEFLFEASLTPALSLCEDGPRPEGLPELAGEEEWYLLEAGDGGRVESSGVEERYGVLIEACRGPRDARGLRRALRPLKIGKGQGLEMASALVEAGVLEMVETPG